MTPEEKYNKVVCENITNISNNKINRDNIKNSPYKDPDTNSNYSLDINNVSINIAQDGICSIGKIFEHSKDVKGDYKLIRKGQFNLVVWPRHRVSINQLRAACFDDRIDLTLVDIKKFFSIVDENTILNDEVKERIIQECKMGKAFVKQQTFKWLQSYRSFDNFLEKRNLRKFYVENPEELSYEEYYDILIQKLKYITDKEKK